MDALPRGRDQPFYMVMPDVRGLSAIGIAYLAEDVLRAAAPAAPGAAGAVAEHPYTYMLFLGPDAQGGYVPTQGLRERFGAARHDVGPPPSDDGGAQGSGE